MRLWLDNDRWSIIWAGLEVPVGNIRLQSTGLRMRDTLLQLQQCSNVILQIYRHADIKQMKTALKLASSCDNMLQHPRAAHFGHALDTHSLLYLGLDVHCGQEQLVRRWLSWPDTSTTLSSWSLRSGDDDDLRYWDWWRSSGRRSYWQNCWMRSGEKRWQRRVLRLSRPLSPCIPRTAQPRSLTNTSAPACWTPAISDTLASTFYAEYQLYK